jgi:hypothetical protein
MLPKLRDLQLILNVKVKVQLDFQRSLALYIIIFSYALYIYIVLWANKYLSILVTRMFHILSFYCSLVILLFYSMIPLFSMPSSDSLFLHTCDVMQKPPCKEVFHLQARGTCGMRSCKYPGWRIRSLACVNVIFTNTNIPVTNFTAKR